VIRVGIRLTIAGTRPTIAGIRLTTALINKEHMAGDCLLLGRMAVSLDTEVKVGELLNVNPSD
jgi:hypothetical protein